MPLVVNQLTEPFHAQFHRRWNHLNNPHVRALAWLLYSPDLLDVHAARWGGKIASLRDHDVTATYDWLTVLDNDPAQLQTAINEKPTYRLGYYAERLMTFYFQHLDVLVGHSIQVQSSRNDTVGEFDFLLRDGDALAHWEFATKFYLLADIDGSASIDHFVGRNLADTLNAKMHKILQQQLLLAQHPAAQIHLPQLIFSAQALVKGWLFYHRCNGNENVIQLDGISAAHCRGFWCTQSEWQMEEGKRAIVLPSMHWLAPAKLPLTRTTDSQSIMQTIQEHFQHQQLPLLIGVMEQQGDYAIEMDRGFIVPDDWPDQARQYLQSRSLSSGF
jgi:hypothetical protein